jgi:hypothetical protein
MSGYKNNIKQFSSFQYRNKAKYTGDVELDEFAQELLKHDINITKWYHILLMGNYFNKNGELYYVDDPIIKKLAHEYTKAYSAQNVETLILIKNELTNHLPEQVWIHRFFSGNVYDKAGNQLCFQTPEMKTVSDAYNRAYTEAYTEACCDGNSGRNNDDNSDKQV